jgi:hypothetical protein
MIGIRLLGCALLISISAVAAGAEPFAGRIDLDNASERLVGGPDAVGGIGDWGLSNGTLCAVVADPEHEGYVLPTGGSLVDLGYCGRADDQFVILEGLSNLSRTNAPHWTGVEASSDASEARVVVRGERDGVEITTTYSLDTERPEVLRVATRLERKADGERLFAFGDVSIHYSGTLRPYTLARDGTSEGFHHQATGDATVRELMGAIVPIETAVLIGSRSADKPISYALRISDARFEQIGKPPRRVPTFGLTTETVTFLGVLARPVWVGGNEHAGLLQLAQTLFMDLSIGEALVFEREIQVAPRTDAVAFTDALRPGAAVVRGTTSDPNARVHIVRPDGSAVGFAAPDAQGAFALRVPPGSYEARVRGDGGQRLTHPFEVGDADLDLGLLALPAAARVELPADLAPARLAFRGVGDTPNPVFQDDHTGMRMGDQLQLAHTATSDVHLGGFPDDPDHVLLAPGRYRVYATRGPEFDIRSSEIEVAAGETHALELEPPLRVLETPGWISADLHVHAEPSDDSTVPMRVRLASFLAEGGEVIVSTDHDHISDYAPLIDSLNLRSRVRSIVGLEVTSTVATEAAPFTAGHSNVFPLPYRPLAHRKGAIRSEGRRLRELIAAARAIPGERLFQLNHAREPETGAIAKEGAFFSHLSIGQSFDPTLPLDDPTNRSLLERDPTTGLRDLDFDAMELMNGPSMFRYRKLRTDWFALLRQGERPTASGNSDTHDLESVPAVPRNYVRMTDDAPAAFDEAEFIANLKAGASFITTGPILEVRFAEPVTNGKGQLLVSVRTAPWIPVSQLRVFVNGELTHERAISEEGTSEIDLSFDRDAFVTVEVEGEPSEAYAALLPNFVPFAFTNAIFVDANQDKVWQPPGLQIGAGVE